MALSPAGERPYSLDAGIFAARYRFVYFTRRRKRLLLAERDDGVVFFVERLDALYRLARDLLGGEALLLYAARYLACRKLMKFHGLFLLVLKRYYARYAEEVSVAHRRLI